jgi:hypothetical protein
VWIATPSLYETFIHNTLPTFTGASELLNGRNHWNVSNLWNNWNRFERNGGIACAS